MAELKGGNGTAILSSEGEYSSFSYGDCIIRFYTGKNLKRYAEIKEWDHGYLVVTCETRQNPSVCQEDYIDLQPILENLYIDSDKFLQPIKEVKIKYA